jgi:hypothetical protein
MPQTRLQTGVSSPIDYGEKPISNLHPFNLISPQYDAKTASWSYPGLEVFNRPDGMQGVRATKQLPKDTAIEYHGRVMDRKMWTALQELQKTEQGKTNKVADYIMELQPKTEYVDGHPRYNPYNGVGERGLFLAAKINEPGPGTTANMKGWNVGDGPHRKSLLAAKRSIRKNEELLFHYGQEYERDYPVGDP